MDRIDAMRVFTAAHEKGRRAKAGLRSGKSATAVSRAIFFLEQHVGTEFLHRTTRSLKLSEAGERYAAACRRILTDLLATGERSAPRGTLQITAPVAYSGELLLRLIDEDMNAYPAVTVRLHLLDRTASLIDEGIDVALHIAHLSDSTLIAIKVGEVRRVIAAAPSYLRKHPRISEPADLAQHQTIAMSHFGIDSWSFPPAAGSRIAQAAQFSPRLQAPKVRACTADIEVLP